MKIIRQGTNPSEKVYRGVCRTCSTEIEFERREAHYQADQRDGDYLSIGCPTCSKAIIVSV